MKRNKKKAKYKKILISKKIRLLSIGVTSILLIVMLISLMSTITTGKFTDQKNPEYSYNNKAQVNYQVFLKPNNIYPSNQKSIGEGNIYVKKLVDYIDTNFTYEFNGQTPTELKGKYSVRAVIEGQLGDDKAKKTIWKHEEQLLSQKSFNVNSDKHMLEAKVQVKPQHFQEIANDKSIESDIDFDAKLTIYWNIEIDGITDKGIFNEKLMTTMDIPINTEKYFEIKGEFISDKKGVIETAIKVISPSYISKLLLYSIGSIIWIILVIVTLFYTAPKPAADVFQLKLKRIFKNHGDRLVRLVDEEFIAMVDLIYVKEFEDLVRIADDVGRPIFYKDREGANEISTFYVLDERYVYILKLNESIQTAMTLENAQQQPSESGIFIRY